MHTNPEVLALVALGERTAATPQDLDHIAHCPVCEREISELGRTTQVGRSISDHFTLESPSPEVWERIRAQLRLGDDFSSVLLPPASRPASKPPLPTPRAVSGPADSGSDRSAHAGRRRPRRALVLALALVVALLAGVGGTLLWQRLHPAGGTVVSAVSLNAMPSWAGASGRATLIREPDGSSWLEVSMATPHPVSGTTEVWLMNRDATDMVAVGAMTTSPQRLRVPAGVDLDRLPVVDVSVESSAEPTSHSGDSIVRGTLDL